MSKFIYFDFYCKSCDTKFDDMVKPDVFEAPCPNCNSAGTRLISAPRLDPKMGLDPTGFPTMGDKWAKVREQRAKIDRSHYKEHGTNRTPGADTAG